MILELNELHKIKDENITICAGWFDMFHIGHLRFLNNAKAISDKLLVVVMNDTDGKYLKGETRPIINENNRAEIIDNIKCVDYTVISKNIRNKTPYPSEYEEDIKTKILWERYIPLIEEIKPLKVFSLEETLKHNRLGDYIKNLGIKVIYTDRINDVSTTDIENKLRY